MADTDNKSFKLTVFYDHILNASKQSGLSVEEVATRAASFGIKGVEMDYYMLEAKGDELADFLVKCGIPINCCYCFFDWINKPDDKSYLKVLDALKRNHISHLLVVPGFMDVAKYNKEIERLQLIGGFSADVAVIPHEDIETAQNIMLPNMKALLEAATERGISVAMEDFDDISAPFATAEQVRWFLDRVPGLGCAFDTGNFIYSEKNVIKAYELLRDRITYVHCKDRSFTPVKGEEYKATVAGRKMFSSAVGSGVIPMTQILNLLKKDNYSDIFAIEHFGSLNQLRDMESSAGFLKQHIGG